MKKLLLIVVAGVMWPAQGVLGGIGLEHGAQAQEGAAPGGQPAVEEQAVEAPRPEVELLEAGEEPRQALRYDPPVGQTERATMDTKMSMSVSVDGQPMPAQAVPPTTMVMRMTTLRAGEEGFDYSFLFEDVKVDEAGQMGAMMRQAMAPLVGVSGDGTISPRGEALAFEPEGLDDMPASTRDQIESMSSQASQLGLVLPEEPIGVGARWRVVMSLTNGGMEMQQTSTATLESIDEGVLRISLELEQSAPEQEFAPPQMGGMKLKLLSLSGLGTGEMTVDPKRLIPLRSTSSIETKMRMSMNMGGPQTVAQTLSMTMAVRGEIVEDDGGDEEGEE